MKTSTLLFLGGAAALTYYLVKRQNGAAGPAVSGPAQEVAVSALSANSPGIIVNEMPADPDSSDYYVPPVGWGPSWGGYRGAWRGNWGGRGGGRRGGHRRH